MGNIESYTDRIKGIHELLPDDIISLTLFTEKCMDMLVSDFNELEDNVIILHETGNEDALRSLTESIILS